MNISRLGASPSVILLSAAYLLLPVIPLSAQTLFVPGTVGSISGSNVGIGTTNPQGQLSIVNTSGFTLQLDKPTGASIQFSRNGTNGYQIDDNSGAMRWISSGTTERMRLETSGNLGIGTANPLSKLDVFGAVRIDNGTDQANFFATLASRYDAAHPFSLAVENNTGGTASEVLGVYSPAGGGYLNLALGLNGNVGIGTTAPEARLHVNKTYATPTGGIGATTTAIFSNNNAATADSAISILARSSASSQINFGSEIGEISGQVSYSPSSLGGLTAGSMLIKTLGSERMRIDGNGNVGIGTTNPTQKLSVNGTIRAKEVIVDTGWSDYVFKADYKLASLSEVEGAIARDGHLPGIPSAQEVAEHGVSVGEMQSKLLAKIEELTLHQIDQEKRLVAQQNEIAALRNRLGEIVPK